MASAAEPPRSAAGATLPRDLGPFLNSLRHEYAACGCCPALVENEQQHREIRARHHEFFEEPSEPINEHPDWERQIEEGLGLPYEERLNGMVGESWY